MTIHNRRIVHVQYIVFRIYFRADEFYSVASNDLTYLSTFLRRNFPCSIHCVENYLHIVSANTAVRLKSDFLLRNIGPNKNIELVLGAIETMSHFEIKNNRKRNGFAFVFFVMSFVYR